MRSLIVQCGVLVALATPLAAQVRDSATFIVRRGNDTVVVERTTREDVTVKGQFVILGKTPHLELWSAVLSDSGTMPLLEMTERDTATAGGGKAPITRRSRFIFRDDSVAVDDLTGKGMFTRIFPSKVGAVPFRNLSFGLLEPVVQYALRDGRAGGEVAFFNVSGAQTAMGSIRRTTPGHADLSIGQFTIDLTVDDRARIVAADIPAQGVHVERH